MFRWVLIKDHPGVRLAERNLTRSNAEVQDSGASSIFEEVRSDAEVQTAKQGTTLRLSDSASERDIGTSRQKKRQWGARARGVTRQVIAPRRK